MPQPIPLQILGDDIVARKEEVDLGFAALKCDVTPVTVDFFCAALNDVLTVMEKDSAVDEVRNDELQRAHYGHRGGHANHIRKEEKGTGGR